MTTLNMQALTLDELTSIRQQYPQVFNNSKQKIINLSLFTLLIAYTLGSLWYFEIWRLFDASERTWRLIKAMFIWQEMASWQYANIYKGIAQTLAMAFLGTLLASVLALFFGFLAARNTMPYLMPRQITRRFLDILRGVDQLVWGLVFVRAVGLGPLAGVLAIFVSDTGTLAKLYSEAIENVDRKQVEGVHATGADPLKVVRYGYLPQVLPLFISQSLYFFESSTRGATVLGLVGAGGIGMIIIERFRANMFDQVAFVVLNVLICIYVIDWLSARIRNYLIGSTAFNVK